MERFGRKKTFGVCVVLTAAFIFIQFFARSLPVLVTGELLGGLVLGTYAVIAPAYASEVCPIALRGVLTSYVNLCFVIGQLLVCCSLSDLALVAYADPSPLDRQMESSREHKSCLHIGRTALPSPHSGFGR